MTLKTIPAGHRGFERITEAATAEFGQLMELVRQAVRDKLKGTPGASDYYINLCALFADRAVYMLAGRYYSVPYSVNADNTVTVGDAAEVVQQFAQVREAANAGAVFREAADGSGAIEVTLITAGISLNGNYYSDQLLRESVPMFEGVRVFSKPDAVHSAGGGKDVHNLLGGIYSVHFVEGAQPDAGRLVGTFRAIDPADPVVTKMTEAVRRGLANLMGLSIDAEARIKKTKRNGQTVREALAFTKVHSVDLIVEPGAGGGLDRLTEAAATLDPSLSTAGADAMSFKKHALVALAAISATAAAAFNIDSVSAADVTEALREACLKGGLDYKAVLTAAENGADEAGVKAAVGRLVEAARVAADTEAVRAREAAAAAARGSDSDDAPVTRAELALREARMYARSAVATSTLPQAAKDKLLPELLQRASLTEAAVDQAIKGEREYLARFTESGRPTGGMPRIEVGDRRAAVADMLDAFFDPNHRDHHNVRSFKECYVEITGDRYVSGRADRARLSESVGTDTFANALGDSITRRMQQIYRDAVAYGAWRQVASVVPVGDFRTQERTQIGGYGDMPIVAQRGNYTALSDPSDAKATYAVAKRGGTAPVTMEAIKNDDVGAILAVPRELGRSAARTLYKFVFNFFAANAAVHDGVALFHASHNNLFTGALSATELAAHRLAMKKQTGRDTATRMEIGPRFLLVPDDLEEAAVNLFRKNTNNDKTFVQSLTCDIIPVSTWTDVTDWCTVADPMDIPVLEIGFLDGQEEPTLLVQNSPTEGSVFTNDMITYKLRHTYGGNVLVDGWKGTTKAVVAG